MTDYTLTPRNLPLDDSWDVIVAGGGPAGCAAATAAARDGARTLLIEATGCLGGMGTAGLVTCWCPFSDGEKMIYRGLAERIFNESKRFVPHVPAEKLDWVALDPERLKVIYDELVTGAGATVLFNTQLAAVDAAAGTVEALILCNKAGLTACRAKVYIDCTGDADLAAWAGAEFQQGDPQTGELQPASHCFMLSNVDTHAYQYGPPLHPDLIKEIVNSGKYPVIKDTHSCNTLIGPGTVAFNSGHLWDVDNTDPVSVSKAMMAGRKLARALRDSLAEFNPPAFGNAFLAATAPLMGVRESRRIIGDYVLTLNDYLARRSFADEIARNAYPIDIHTTRAEAESGETSNVMARYENYQPGESHGLPYRCLTPKGLGNVLVAGRSISTDRIVQGSTRVMPVCLCMGEAAGAAAAMACESGSDRGPDVHAVNPERLRTRLREAGAWLP